MATSNQNQGSPPAYEQDGKNGIPPQSRRSMEDENRELPPGWIRQYDPQEHHQFFVDTTANPPRSIWHHPFDDSTYLNSLPEAERARIHGLHRVPSIADIEAESSDDDHDHDEATYTQRQNVPEIPPTGFHKFGRRMKDKITHSTHEERVAQRGLRAAREQRIYQQHQMYRAAMSKAAMTGEPQFIGKDHQGKDVFIEPPYGATRGYGQNAYGYNPYVQGPYSNTNATYLRPSMPYSRPGGYYGYGYGGGMGLPLAMGLGGGLLLGGLL